MGEIKKQIGRLTRDARSKSRARRAAEEWFEESVKALNEKSVASTPQRFRPGKIYVFRYEQPKHADSLEWWDMNPVVLALDPVDDNDLGINLNLLPVGLKEDMLDFIYEKLKNNINRQAQGSKSNDAIRQGSIGLSYEGAKRFLQQYGFDFAIRQYIPSRKSNQAVVAYEEWPRIALCDLIELNGATVGQIRYRFRRNLNKR